MKEHDEIDNNEALLEQIKTLEEEQKAKAKKVRGTSRNAVSMLCSNMLSAIPKEYGYDISKDANVEELIDPDDSPTINAFAQERDEWIPMPRVSYTSYPVVNPAAYAQHQKKTLETATIVDQYILKLQEEGQYSADAAEFLRASLTHPLKDAMRGFHQAELTRMSPLGISYSNSMGAFFNLALPPKELSKNIEKWKEKFPIFDAVRESAKQTRLMSDYMKEKEKGSLTELKKKTYREQLYVTTKNLLSMIDTIDNTVKDEALVQELIHDKVMQNKPVVLHSVDQRGQGMYRYTLEAYKTGLENGWDIEDLGAIAWFKQIHDQKMDGISTNAYTSQVDYYSDYKFYDPPHYDGWKSEEDRKKQKPEDIKRDQESMRKHKEFLDGMENLYREMISSPPDAEKRTEFFRRMKETIQSGVDQNYFRKTTDIEYFDRLMDNLKLRDLRIQAGIEKAGAVRVDPELTSEKLDIEGRKDWFNRLLNGAKRGITSQNESPAHKEVMRSARNLWKLIKQQDQDVNDHIEHSMEEKAAFADKYMQQMDDLICKLRKYRKLGADEKIPNAGGRMRGIAQFEEAMLAKQEKFFDDMKRQGIIRGSMEDYRMNFASRKCMEGMKKLNEMPAFPDYRNTGALKEMMIAAADVLTGSIGMDQTEPCKNAMKEAGFNELKMQILNDKDFRALIVKAMKDKSMTPAKLAQELANGNPLKKLKGMNKSKQKDVQKAAANARVFNKQKVIKAMGV